MDNTFNAFRIITHESLKITFLYRIIHILRYCTLIIKKVFPT